MIKLIKLKPKAFLFMIMGLIPIMFFIVWLLARILGSDIAIFSVFLFFGSLIGFYLLWINTIFLSLNMVKIKNGFSSRNKSSMILFIILFSIYLLRMIISLPYFESIETLIGMAVNILIGVFIIILITYLFYEITDNYIYITKNRASNIVDYFIMMFYFSFFIIGLMILHSKIRLILKENNILEE